MFSTTSLYSVLVWTLLNAPCFTKAAATIIPRVDAGAANFTDLNGSNLLKSAPAALQLPQSPAAAIALSSTHQTYPISRDGDPSPQMYLEVYDPKTPMLYEDLAPLIIACQFGATRYMNRDDADLPSGLFGCSDNNTAPKTFLSMYSVAQGPPVTGRTVLQYLSTVLRGLNEWGRYDGNFSSGVVMARGPAETQFLFVMQLGFYLKPGDGDSSPAV